MDAVEIVAKLKDNDRYARIPIVIHATLLSSHVQQQLLEEGACILVEKGSVMDAIKEYQKIL